MTHGNFEVIDHILSFYIYGDSGEFGIQLQKK
jgi:hypothetical protein